jgi:LysR family transcriptional regulator, transcriptional activator of the cysJI operon
MQDFRMDTFLTVCRLLNYTKAAEELHITQPAVSQHIRYLEDYYEVRLIRFEGKKLCLTDEGCLLRNAATTMRHDEIILREQLKMGKHRKLVFGATLTIGDFVLPSVLARFMNKNPETEVRMTVDNTETLLKQIDSGELDFAVIEGYFHKAEYDYKVYSAENYIAVCSAAYKFQQEPKILSDLFSEPIILREQGSGTREIFERHMEERNCSVRDFRQIIEIGSISAIKLLAAESCGITFLYEAAAKRELESGTLRQIPLSDFEVRHNFTFVWRKNSIFDDRYHDVFDELLQK